MNRAVASTISRARMVSIPCGISTVAPTARAAVEQQLAHVALRQDAEIGAPPRRRVEIGHRRRDAVGGRIVLRRREIAIDEGAVLIVEIAEAGLFERARRGLREAAPLGALHALDRERAALAVELVGEIVVVLELAKYGKTSCHAQPAAPASAHSS